MIKTFTTWNLSLRSHNQTDYVSKDIQDFSKLSRNKKKQVQKAIQWLLSIAPHSIEEIADHFEISTKLVKGLIVELNKANMVVKIPGKSRRYYMNTKSLNGYKEYGLYMVIK